MQSDTRTQDETEQAETAIPFVSLKDISIMPSGIVMDCLIDYYLFHGNHTTLNQISSNLPTPRHALHVTRWSSSDEMSNMLILICRREEATISFASDHFTPGLPVFHVTVSKFYMTPSDTWMVSESSQWPHLALCRALLKAVACRILQSTAPISE